MLDFICKMNQIKRCQSFPCFCFNLKKVKSFCSGSWSLARLQDFVIPGQVFFVWVVRVHRCFGPNKMPPSHIQVGHGSHFFIVQAKVPNLNVLDNPTTDRGSLDRISLDRISWSKFSNNLGVWSKLCFITWSKFLIILIFC